MQYRTISYSLLVLCGMFFCLLLSSCSSPKETQEETVDLSMEDLIAANDLDALCTKYGAVTYQLKNVSEEDSSTSWSTYWRQDGELVCSITSNLKENSDVYYTPTANFSSLEGLTYVSCPIPDAGVSNTPSPPYPNGFLTDPGAQDTLEGCKKTKTGYTFTLTYHYDEDTYTESTFTTDEDLVITGCQSLSTGKNLQTASSLSVAFYQNPMEPPEYVTEDPVILTLISLTGETEQSTDISIPRNCLLSVYGTETTVVSWDAYGTKLLDDEITVAADLTLYAIDLNTSPVG